MKVDPNVNTKDLNTETSTQSGKMGEKTVIRDTPKSWSTTAKVALIAAAVTLALAIYISIPVEIPTDRLMRSKLPVYPRTEDPPYTPTCPAPRKGIPLFAQSEDTSYLQRDSTAFKEFCLAPQKYSDLEVLHIMEKTQKAGKDYLAIHPKMVKIEGCVRCLEGSYMSTMTSMQETEAWEKMTDLQKWKSYTDSGRNWEIQGLCSTFGENVAKTKVPVASA